MTPGRGGDPRRPRGSRHGRPASTERDSAEAARDRAVGLLSRRDYARRALKQRLEDSGFAADAAESAVAALEEERLVNDGRYVEAAVASAAGRGYGPVRIALDLRRQGVAGSLIAAAIDARSPEWAERAGALRRRRFGAEPPTVAKDRARQVRFLLQRGFSGEQVRAALGPLAARDLELDDRGGDDGNAEDV